MDSFIGSMILIQILLIGLNAVFACGEIAVISFTDAKLESIAAQGDKRALRLTTLTNQPAKFLATIQVAITLSGFLGSALAADNFSDILVTWLLDIGVPLAPTTLDTIAVIFITIVLSFFTLVFGELVPKRIAMKKAEKIALSLSGLIYLIAKIFAPLVWLLTESTDTVLRLIGIDPKEEEAFVSEEEIRMMVDVGNQKGTIDHDEKQFIQNIFEFDDLQASDIYRHRKDVAILNMNESIDQWDQLIHDSRHTLYPVCDDSTDHIIGILNAKDYFRLLVKTKEEVINKAMTQPYFVPSTVPADILFSNMKHARNQMAIVVDEYGGVMGIVTMNDLVELLVGDLEEDQGVINKVQQVSQNVWKVIGNWALDDLSKAIEYQFESKHCDTLSGFIFEILATIPKDHEVVEVETSQLHIQVTKLEDHQIAEAIITIK